MSRITIKLMIHVSSAFIIIIYLYICVGSNGASSNGGIQPVHYSCPRTSTNNFILVFIFWIIIKVSLFLYTGVTNYKFYNQLTRQGVC